VCQDKGNVISEEKNWKENLVMQKQSLTTSHLMPSQSPSNGYFGKTPPSIFIADRGVRWHGM